MAGVKFHTEETKKRIAESTRKAALEKGFGKWNKGRTSNRKGIPNSDEQKRKISIANKGHKAWNKGLFGDKSCNWKGGKTEMGILIRNSLEYKLWRTAVFERDNYTCIWCGFKGYIEADHIQEFSLYPELRFAIDNGRTLCRRCHKSRHKMKG